ncbi:BRCA2 and CDKN1A-interacting protein [Orycteropus afer afer]|uniref:BRCA2 and CDKN1A-interacting protein n=1 Tax=Orycteropus afer afer TaxID=1230840 RepID=A0A8B6ZHD5_ORYAF|nr:BRCA2 and CDKN1A-interacting protein [Orycteropus afer afer]
MASGSKRRALGSEVPRPQAAALRHGEEEDEDEVEDEEDDSDEEDDEVVDEEVTVEFEAHTISENDHDGIKKLLQQLFLKAPVNTAELTDLLIQQSHVGSVLKQTDVSEDSGDDVDVDEDEIFGFISLLNLTERKGTQCAEQIKELILSCCERSAEKSVVEQLDRLLNDTARPVGLLLSERLINVPPQIALPMHQQLHMAQSDSSTRTVTVACSRALFVAKAVLKFSYSVQEESDTCLGGRWSFDDIPMKPLRTVMLIPADSMEGIMEKLKEHLSL